MAASSSAFDVQDPSSHPPRKRVRDPAAKRAAIVAAAQDVFSERGYTAATIREIARRAGVGHGLVMLHFRSKQELFLASVPGTRDVAAHLTDDPHALPLSVARAFVARMEASEGPDPFLTLVRSAGSDRRAAAELLVAMQEHSASQYRTVLDAPDLDARVAMLGAHLAGVTLARYVLHVGPLAEMSAEDLVERLAEILRVTLFD
jgi:AcrR family transcriptional regulator